MSELDSQPDPPNPVPPVAPGGVELAPGVFVADGVLRFQYARSSGPGGQNVNKVNTKAELWLPVSALARLDDAARTRLRTLAGSRLTVADEIHIAAESKRSQEGNRADALERLRELIVEAMRVPRKRRKTRPTKASRRRRLEGKRHRGAIKSNRRAGGKAED
jgi:ribosome-associated protein